MARKTVPEGGPPAAGEPRRTTTRTTVKTEHLPEESRDAPIEAWLADLAGDASIAYVRVWKRNGTRWGWLGKRNDIQPPFDFDLDQLFQQYGDGEYRLVPYDTSGQIRGGRNELVQAGYTGSVRVAADGTTTRAPADAGDDTMDMSELIRMARQNLILNNLREAAGVGRQGGAEYVPAPADDVGRLAQLAQVLAVMQPKPTDVAGLLAAIGSIVSPILAKILSPPDPADKMLGLVEKFLDIRERIEPAGGGDTWQTLLFRGLASLAENPAVRQLIAGQVVTAPPIATVAIAPTVAALPAAPATAPSPANGHPDAGSTAAPAGTDADAIARQTLAQMVWPLIKRAALAATDDFETYAALVDQQLPGFLEQWANADANQAMIFLGQLDRDVLTNMDLQRWLIAFHTFVRSDFLHRDADDAGGEPGTERIP
jgi:hypothetical protein